MTHEETPEQAHWVSDESAEIGFKTMTSSLDDVQHINSINEFERQVYGRINSQGFTAEHISKYMVNSAEEKDEVDVVLEKAIQQIPGVTGQISWDTGKKVKAPAREAQGGPFSFECDLYLHFTKVNGGGKVSLKSILSEVSDEFRLLNSDNRKDTDGHDVDLGENHFLWMEIAETPNSLRNKLKQLERAFLYYKKNKDSEEGKKLGPPSAAVICLNGDKATYETAVTHIQKLYDDGKLTRWEILKPENNVRVFVTFTPFRNVYGTLQTIKSDMAKLKAELKADMATKSSKWDIYMVLAAVLGLGVLQMQNKR